MNRKYDWPKILEDFAKSQLSVHAYARQHNISSSALYRRVQAEQNSNTETTRQRPSDLVLLRERVHEIKLDSQQRASKRRAAKETDLNQTGDLLFRMKLGQAELEFHELPNPQWFAEVIRCF